jgi:hypothetical protein
MALAAILKPKRNGYLLGKGLGEQNGLKHTPGGVDVTVTCMLPSVV